MRCRRLTPRPWRWSSGSCNFVLVRTVSVPHLCTLPVSTVVALTQLWYTLYLHSYLSLIHEAFSPNQARMARQLTTASTGQYAKCNDVPIGGGSVIRA